MNRLIPVVVIKEITETERIVAALRAHGLDCAEITFRTPCAEEAIRRAAEKFPDMRIGAGTVLCAEQCRKAIAAGARFVVSPGLDRGVAQVCKAQGVPYYPGCVTPTEIMEALELGLTVVKFFPANVYGGLPAMQALSAPFPQVKFIPTGGVNRENAEAYLAWEKTYAVGGSFLTEEALRVCE